MRQKYRFAHGDHFRILAKEGVFILPDDSISTVQCRGAICGVLQARYQRRMQKKLKAWYKTHLYKLREEALTQFCHYVEEIYKGTADRL
jgi:hypothetical protein